MFDRLSNHVLAGMNTNKSRGEGYNYQGNFATLTVLIVTQKACENAVCAGGWWDGR